jgi:hypothetical protein
LIQLLGFSVVIKAPSLERWTVWTWSRLIAHVSGMPSASVRRTVRRPGRVEAEGRREVRVVGELESGRLADAALGGESGGGIVLARLAMPVLADRRGRRLRGLSCWLPASHGAAASRLLPYRPEKITLRRIGRMACSARHHRTMMRRPGGTVKGREHRSRRRGAVSLDHAGDFRLDRFSGQDLAVVTDAPSSLA